MRELLSFATFVGMLLSLGLCTSDARPVVINEMQVFPIGWTSEGQISRAISNVKFDPIASYRVDGNEVLFFAPFSGRLQEDEDRFVLEGNAVRVVYPKKENATVIRIGDVTKGEPTVRYLKAEAQTFIFFLRNLDSPSPNIGFENGALDVTTSRSIKVFSLTSGTLLITPKLFDEDTNFILSIMGDLFQVTYMGITNVFCSNSSTVSHRN